ncbi:MAG: F0F1 ATP synthase subunit A [Elusimicrobia bacterium]|nr:F0F1 ATP synthase subunit A [Elusimicrobiota bacterium]
MNIDEVLAHHLLDHSFGTLFTVAGIPMNLTKHLLVMWLVGAFMLMAFTYAARGAGQGALLLRTGVEAVVIYLRDEIVLPLVGHDGEGYLHYFVTLFFFILFCNLAGVLPLDAVLKFRGVGIGGTPTGNISVPMGLSVCTLVFIVFGGMRAQGFWGFWRHFVPLPPGTSPVMMVLLGPLLFALEVIGVLVKCGALVIRLFANMIAGHIVIIGFFSLIFLFGAASKALGVFGVGPLTLAMVTFSNFLELLIALIQAFVFMLLTAVFVGLVAQHH